MSKTRVLMAILLVVTLVGVFLTRNPMVNLLDRLIGSMVFGLMIWGVVTLLVPEKGVRLVGAGLLGLEALLLLGVHRIGWMPAIPAAIGLANLLLALLWPERRGKAHAQ